MIKLFSNGCEGTTQLKAEPFKPTAVLEDFVNLMNMLYDGQGNLFEIKKYNKRLVVAINIPSNKSNEELFILLLLKK